MISSFDSAIMMSVIICTYNRCESLRQILQCLLFQDFDKFKYEIIVVDNNSTDNTREIVTEMSKSSAVSIKYIFENRQGLCYARNTGIQYARGEIIAFTDDDVLLDKYFLPTIKTFK